LVDRMSPLRPGLNDLVAGLSVFLVLIPQGLAYAELAGMPTQLGLIAGVLPPIVAAFLVSSPYLQTGPTALTALLVAGALTGLAAPGSPDWVLLGSLLALMVGILRVAFGLLRLGIAAYFVSQPVLTGFTTGAALLIAGTQVGAIVGVSSTNDRVMGRAIDALAHPGDWSWPTIAIGLLTLGLTIGLRKVHALFPSVLVAVAVSWILSSVLGLDVATIGDIPGELPSLSLDLPYDRVLDLVIPAAVIALVGFVEPASIARNYATAKRERWSANQEFLSQGAANIAAAVSGTFPVGGSFGRSSLNERAGATSRWSGFVTGVTMLVFLPFASVLGSIPRAALGAVVISAAMTLIRLDRIAAMWAWSKPQTATSAVTLVATLGLDPRIDEAILLGIVISVGVHLWREIQVHVTVTEVGPDLLRISPYGVMWFGSVNKVVETVLATVADHPHVNQLVIDLQGVGRLDLTAAGDLAGFANDQRANGMKITFDNVPPHAERLFNRMLRTDA
jgi:SulP family sulfate permease